MSGIALAWVRTNLPGELMAIKLIAIDMDGTFCCPIIPFHPPLKMRLPQLAPWRECCADDGAPLCRRSQLLKELHMEQPGDYCITYNGALYRRPLMAAPWRKPLSAMTTTFPGKTLPRSRFSFPRPGPHPLYTANRDISYYTVHESFVAPFRWCSAKRRKWTPIPSS